MSSIKQYLTGEHKSCDNLFSDLENAVANRDWDKANEAFKAFFDDTEKHFQKEERVLFPALEEMMGSSEGPTQVMRMEHAQMRAAMAQMQEDLTKQDADHFLGLSETFNILIQQHNMKEEQILYTMSDNALAPRADQIIDLLEHLEVE